MTLGSNTYGSNPMLCALANNGGLTQTHRLLTGSAVIDRGSNALAVNPLNNTALATDQRGAGFPRIIDGDGNGTATVDIGPFEVQFAPPAANVSVSGRGIKNVLITLTDSTGNTSTARTTTFGRYGFREFNAGETYVISAKGKRFTFSQPTQVLNVNEDAGNIDFIANP